jgi:hypothetical protein
MQKKYATEGERVAALIASQRKARRKYYLNNKAKSVASTKRWRIKNRDRVNEWARLDRVKKIRVNLKPVEYGSMAELKAYIIKERNNAKSC